MSQNSNEGSVRINAYGNGPGCWSWCVGAWRKKPWELSATKGLCEPRRTSGQSFSFK
jgi:hypothetical protein